jgi:uncharacterized SAM-binding protein YcdF (DUF218 family)
MMIDGLRLIAKLLLLPPMLPLILGFAGVAISRRLPRSGRALMLGCLGLLTVLAMPATSDLLVRAMDRSPPLDLTKAKDAQAIVILGGGTRLYAPEYGGATLSTITLQRVRYGARIARATGLPILVSGGSLRSAPPEAILMRDALVHEFGTPVRWVERRSRNTHENAYRSARILERDGVARVILVGHSFDFPRSRIEFERQGIEVIAAPIDIPQPDPDDVGDFVPSAAGLQGSYYALYEILANLALWLESDPHQVVGNR